MLPINVLLFSADIPLSNSIKACLSPEGYKVLHMADGIDALDLIHAVRPAMVIMDFNLPSYSSLAIIRALRTTESPKRTPLILIGSMREEDILIGLEVGADLCLVEDFHPRVFVARLRSLIRRSEPVRTQ